MSSIIVEKKYDGGKFAKTKVYKVKEMYYGTKEEIKKKRKNRKLEKQRIKEQSERDKSEVLKILTQRKQ